MLKAALKSKLWNFTLFILGVLFSFLLFNQYSCSAAQPQTQANDSYAINGIRFYSPSGCKNKSINAKSCFKVDTSVEASDAWYAEGCLDNGECTSGVYASTLFTNSESPNHFLLSDTKVDPDFGNLQYIYAENYDIEFDAYNGWIAQFTPNGGSSTRKYYWIVLPDKAYTTAFGETYVATFENVDEPVYFIVYDAHACTDQGEDYCGQAESDPSGVAIGKQFFGTFSKEGGSYTAITGIVGKLQTFCRITSRGEVLAQENGVGSAAPSSSNSSSNNPSTESTSSSQKCAKLGKARKQMWDAASQSDKESFMKTVSEEVHDIAGVEIYMNQIIAKHGSDGTLSDWLTGQCERYRPASASCTGSHTITEEEQKWIDEALAGSNNVRFAIGNATGGSTVGAGKIVCVWDGKKCREDVDYTAEGGTGECKVYSSSASYGECLGMEGEDNWADEFKNDCGGNCNTFAGEYPQYYQSNYENSDHDNAPGDWTNIPYNNGTVANSGCGAVSMAMLATVATGKDIYPQDIIEATAPNNYVTSSPTELDPLVGTKYGFEVIPETYSSKSDARAKIKDYLSRGYMIHLSGDGYYPGLSTYDTRGHYIGVFGIDSNDQVWIANSATENSQRSLDSVIDFIHNGVFTAIKGSGGSSCDTYCQNGYVGEEGLTAEQAQVFMRHYGANKNNSSRDAVGQGLWNMCNGGGSNCVTFSAFFMYKFTNIPNKGATGNGNEVVDTVVGWNVGATRGTEPRVWAILSTDPIHTAVVLGHHDGKWIVGHASCSYYGIGEGTGGNGILTYDNMGGGSGFYAVEESDDPGQWQWCHPGVRFAYPSEVYVDKIEEYLQNGV